MKSRFFVLGLLAIFLMMFQMASATPSAEIIFEKPTFGYGEKLVYTIQVSEVTGDMAIIHIRDESGKGSSAIPISISDLKTEISSPYPLEKEVFPEGKYFIDLEYSGASYSAEFNIADLGNVVIPFQVKQMAYNWVNNQMSSGLLIDSIQKIVDKKIINIPYEIDRDHINDIYIPEWVQTITIWWLEEKLSDETFANSFQYLINEKIIKI